ncbi:MAG: hypothetical protein ACI80K_001162 [Paracoccaceae bacterium]
MADPGEVSKPEVVPPRGPVEINGPPRFGWFAGVLEGRVGDRDALHKATDAVRKTRTAPPDLEIEGGRFSLLFDEVAVPGARLDVSDQEALLTALQGVVDASAKPDSVESTLRGSLVYGESVVETLFVPRSGVIEAVSRHRALSAADRSHSPGAAGEEANEAPRLKGVALLGLIAAACLLLAFYGGYVDRARGAFFGTSAEAVKIQTDTFAGSLDVSLERKFGSYLVTVRRGPDYPTTSAEVEARIAAAETPAQRAAASAIADGGDVWLRLEDSEGKVLHATELDLGGLLESSERELQRTLPSKLGTAQLRLSLDPGKKP